MTFILLSDGIGRTGVFCALCIVLERMRSEGVVDLFQTVKLLRTQRPNMIQNQVRTCAMKIASLSAWPKALNLCKVPNKLK